MSTANVAEMHLAKGKKSDLTMPFAGAQNLSERF